MFKNIREIAKEGLKMDRLEQKLRSESLRPTASRRIIFDILKKSERALSAQDICKKMQGSSAPKADQASVYRNLSLFSEIGLIHRLQSGRYTICQHDEDQGHNHMHIVADCLKCGKTFEIKSHNESLCQLAGGFKSFIKDFGSFSGITLQGRCKKCSK